MASTAEQLASMQTTEPFDGSEASLSRFESKWSTLGWASGGTPKGADTSTGWRPVNAFPTVNGAYYNPNVNDSGTGIGAVATMAINPSNAERYFSLWLDMSSPGGTKNGYELRFTDVSSNVYNVTLAKWVAGTQTVLASKSNYSFLNGNSFAVVDQGSAVSAWTNTGSGFNQLLSASDSAFSGGNTGIEGSGNISRLTNFKAGGLDQLAEMPTTEPFDGSEASLSRFASNWSTLNWAAGSSPKGADTSTGWRPVDAFPTVNGTYYNPNISDSGTGIAAVATMATNPSIAERYFSLWLDMSNHASSKNGYELRFTDVSSNVYNVTLAKWVAGTQTVLASKSNYSFLNGNSFAVVDQGSTVSAWTNTGSGFEQLFGASDSALTNGYAGIEASGNISRLTNFKAGELNGDTQPPNTTISAGPTGTIGSSSASFSFTSSEEGSTFQCSMDGNAFAACSSPKTYEGLADGTRSFRVRAIDPSGNQDPTPAERSFQINTLANSVSVDPGSYRSSGADVAGGGAYNYAPSVMLDGPYRMWWCAGIAGDHIVYAESSSLNGPFLRHGAQYQDVLQPTQGSQFDGTHVCDPSVIRVRGTYYMYYGGLTEGTGHVTQIGVASSPDGVSWTKMNNDNPIVTPREPSQGGYGAGQPSAAYVGGYFYLMYTDSSGLEGGLQYAIRSTDPTFQTNVETATASGFVPRTAANTDSYVVSQSFSPDWQYSDALNAWIVLSNQSSGTTFVRFLSKDMSHVLRPDLQIASSWSEGPGLVSTPEKHSLAPANGECQRIPLDFMQSTPPASPPNDIKHFGSDLLTGRGCSALSSAQVSSMFNGYGIEVSGLPLTVVLEGERLQFQLAQPAIDITHNFIGTTSEVFYAIPYGASLFSGSTVLGATGRPAAFLLDNSVLWPVSSIKIITDDNSSITYVSPTEFDSHPFGPALYEAPGF